MLENDGEPFHSFPGGGGGARLRWRRVAIQVRLHREHQLADESGVRGRGGHLDRLESLRHQAPLTRRAQSQWQPGCWLVSGTSSVSWSDRGDRFEWCTKAFSLCKCDYSSLTILLKSDLVNLALLLPGNLLFGKNLLPVHVSARKNTL